jgi:hypothetical protein
MLDQVSRESYSSQCIRKSSICDWRRNDSHSKHAINDGHVPTFKIKAPWPWCIAFLRICVELQGHTHLTSTIEPSLELSIFIGDCAGMAGTSGVEICPCVNASGACFM